MYEIKTELSIKEFWDVYLKLKPNKFTEKERDIIAEHWAGQPKHSRGKYKTYVTDLQKRVPLDAVELPKEVTLQVKITFK